MWLAMLAFDLLHELFCITVHKTIHACKMTTVFTKPDSASTVIRIAVMHSPEMKRPGREICFRHFVADPTDMQCAM